jgi:hypothetical protein
VIVFTLLPQRFYESVQHLQCDLDDYVVFYNRERANEGYRTQGRTPFQTFSEGFEQMHRREVTSKAA